MSFRYNLLKLLIWNLSSQFIQLKGKHFQPTTKTLETTTNKEYTAKINEDYLHESLYKMAPNACLFTIILKPVTQSDSMMPSSSVVQSLYPTESFLLSVHCRKFHDPNLAESSITQSTADPSETTMHS